MKIGQLVEHISKMFFFSYSEKKVERLVPDLFLFFKKASYEVNASAMQPSFNIF